MSGLLAQGELVGLRPLTPADANDAYLGWLADPDVTRFLEVRFQEHTQESLRAYVERHAGRRDTLLLAIVELATGRHVGNVKVGPCDARDETAELGIMIGAKDVHGRGYGAEAIKLASTLAFDRLGVRKLSAGCYAGNVASARAFRRAGWSEAAPLEARFVDDDGVVHDALRFRLVRPPC